MAKRRGSFREKRETNSIGEYLTNLRVAQGKTQQEVADELGEHGKSKYLICKIERGRRTTRSLEGVILYDVARAYGASVIEILKRAEAVQLPLNPLLDISDEERQELIRYLDEIRQKKEERPPETH
jgi:transcriptional regulator with XRE-family HTH domain